MNTTHLFGRDLRPKLSARLTMVAMAVLALGLAPSSASAGEASGVLVANGVEVELPYVYVWPDEEGIYGPDDPSWRILFVERELDERELGDAIWDSAWVEIGITRTAEFSDQPQLEIFTQSIKFSADANGNISGGADPRFEIEGLGTEQISGRIWHEDTQEFFDDTFSFDLTFTAALSDPNAPVGDPLPGDGGEPGRAYLNWVETIHAGDLDALKRIVPEELAEQLETASSDEIAEHIGFLQTFTPTDVRIVGGSSDGEIAILDIEGKMDGEAVTGEVTMTKTGEFWIPTETSM